MSELARVVAFVVRMQGRDAMTRTEFKQLLSLRLNWYRPADASQLLERALQAGLLEVVGEEHVRAAFDTSTVELPLDFRGSARALEEPLPNGPPPDPATEERARILREAAHGKLSEAASRLLAQRERGQDVKAAASKALADLGVAPFAPRPR